MMTKDFTQGQIENDLLDYYRENNIFSVWRCPTCGFRGVGSSVTLHPLSHGVMFRELMKYERDNKSKN